MAAAPCRACGNLRKIDIIATDDGWSQPPCYSCGDPGYLEPYSEENADEDEESITSRLAPKTVMT